MLAYARSYVSSPPLALPPIQHHITSQVRLEPAGDLEPVIGLRHGPVDGVDVLFIHQQFGGNAPGLQGVVELEPLAEGHTAVPLPERNERGGTDAVYCSRCGRGWDECQDGFDSFIYSTHRSIPAMGLVAHMRASCSALGGAKVPKSYVTPASTLAQSGMSVAVVCVGFW